MTVFDSQLMVDSYTADIDKIGLWSSEFDLFHQYAFKSSNILILGCGAGRVPISLYNLGFENITGLDSSERMINKALENSLTTTLSYCKQDFEDLTAVKNQYDLIFYPYNSLFHIPTKKGRVSSLTTAKRILKKKGIIIFTCHIDRLKGNYKEFWLDKKIETNCEPGNLLIKDRGLEFMMNFPTDQEVDFLIEKSKLSLISRLNRNESFSEKQRVLEYSNNCNFNICSF